MPASPRHPADSPVAPVRRFRFVCACGRCGRARPNRPFDDGNSQLTREGLVLTRYALGLTGAALVNGTDFTLADAPTIQSNIACPSCGLNITGNTDVGGNPVVTVADATIISRKLAGFQGASLTAGLALGSGTRNTNSAVQSFLLAGCGASANGWVQGGNSFGVTGVLGTTDDQFTTIRSGGVLLAAHACRTAAVYALFVPSNRARPRSERPQLNSVGLRLIQELLSRAVDRRTRGRSPATSTTGSTRSCGNVAIENWATIGGGRANRVTGRLATVAGGESE